MLSAAASMLLLLPLLLLLAGASGARVFAPMVDPGRALDIERLATQTQTQTRTRGGFSKTSAPVEGYFKNRIDHFSQQNLATYPQRYFINDEYFSPELGGPIFFQIGGEGAISAAYVEKLMMSHYAKENGALQIALEHRFYGKSHPFDSMATENLQYLSSQQALADAAAFVAHIKAQYPSATKLVIFGGSYPGALAAWFRLKFPHLAAAAVSSSSPVHAVVDMVEYLDVVEKSLAMMGGADCDKNVRSAFEKLDALLTSAEGQKAVTRDFNTCTNMTADPQDQANFLSSIIGNFMGTVQYNREIPGRPTIKEICGVMGTSGGSPYTNLMALAKQFTPNGQCLPISYESMITGLKNLTAWGETSVGMRQWTFQTCNEFGFFQTTDGKDQPFGKGVPLSFYLGICKDVFDLPGGPHVDFTNTYYGSDKPLGATRILFVNGNVDPWHSLSVTQSLTPSLRAILIDGTAHCANMMPPSPSDPPGLLVARNETALQVRQWLADPWQ